MYGVDKQEIIALLRNWIEDGRKRSFSGLDLRGVNLRRVNLDPATEDGRGANLSYTDLRKANLSHASFRNADLTGADLTGAIPPDATIDVAVLSLWCTYQSNTSPIEVNSYRLLRPWNEMQATWNQARTGDSWGQPGAFQFGVDRAPQTATTGILDQKDMWLHLDWTFLVSQWRTNPSINHGAVISGTGWAHVTYNFASSENATQAIRPRLVITYTSPAGASFQARLPLLLK